MLFHYLYTQKNKNQEYFSPSLYIKPINVPYLKNYSNQFLFKNKLFLNKKQFKFNTKVCTINFKKMNKKYFKECTSLNTKKFVVFKTLKKKKLLIKQNWKKFFRLNKLKKHCLTVFFLHQKKSFLYRLILNLKRHKKQKNFIIIKKKKKYIINLFFKKLKKKNKKMVSFYKTKLNKNFFFNIFAKKKKRNFKKQMLHVFYNTKVFLYFFLLLFFIKKKIKLFVSYYTIINNFFELFFQFFFSSLNFTQKNLYFLKQYYYFFKFLFQFYTYIKILFNSFIRYFIFIKLFFKFFKNTYYLNNEILINYLNTHKQWKKFILNWNAKNYKFIIFFKFFFFRLWHQLGLIFQTINYLYYFLNKFLLISFFKIKFFFFFKLLSFQKLDFNNIKEYLANNFLWYNFINDKLYNEYKLNYYFLFIWLLNERFNFFNNLNGFFFSKSKNNLFKKIEIYNAKLLFILKYKKKKLKLSELDHQFVKNFFYYNTFNNKYSILKNKINKNFIKIMQFNTKNYNDFDLKQKYSFFRNLLHKKKKTIIRYKKKTKTICIDYFSIFSQNYTKKLKKNVKKKNYKLFFNTLHKKKKIWIPLKKYYFEKKYFFKKSNILKRIKKKRYVLWYLFYSKQLTDHQNLSEKLFHWNFSQNYSIKYSLKKNRRVLPHHLEPNWKYKLNYDIPENIEIDIKTLRILFLGYLGFKNHFLPFSHKLELLMTSYRNYGF